MKNKIDIICYYDSLHKSLYDIFFYPSFKKYLTENFNLIDNFIETDTNKVTYWKSEHWSNVLINRFDILKEYIKNNQNKWCVFSDIDILFFDNFYKDIEIFISTQLHDIYYMSEFIKSPATEINGGFFLFHCNNRIYEYFDYIQQKTRMMECPNDQTTIQSILKSRNHNIKQTVLPRLNFITNNNPRNKINNLIRNNVCKVFHSTGTGNVIEKTQVLSSVYLKKYGILGTNLWIPPEN